MSDRIEIRDLRVTGVHGVLPEERDRAQPFAVDVVAWVDMTAAQESDDLADTVDYGVLAQTAAEVVGGRSYRLLEALAGRLAERVVDHRRPPGGGRGHGAQAPPAAGPRRGFDRSQGAARALMVPAPTRRAFVGLGSNLGDRRATLRKAVEGLRAGGDVVAVSPLYETEPIGGPAQGPYLNVVVELATRDDPRRLLQRCQALEEEAGRVRTVRWGPRTLDADVLWVEGCTVDEPGLTVPHLRLWERRFVVQPLADLAPELVTAEQLAAAGGDVTRVGSL